jgi:uncharacterized protein with von Willebrand factor type A (vWA) domain
LSLLEALKAGLGDLSAERFYYLARTCLVKDERYYDRFDQGVRRISRARGFVRPAAARAAGGLALQDGGARFTDAEKAEIEALGGWDKLMETLKQRLEEQKERIRAAVNGSARRHLAVRRPWLQSRRRAHRTGPGTQPQRREGLGQARIRESGRQGRTRHPQHQGGAAPSAALRAARRAGRTGAGDTIDATARSGGWLDIKMQAERHNVVKVLLLLDIGGSMDDHVKTCEELFSAARSEFKHLEHYYFHNFTYEALWRDNQAAVQ